MTDPNVDPTVPVDLQQARPPGISYSDVLRVAEEIFSVRAQISTPSAAARWRQYGAAVAELARLIERITDAVATDERSLALTDLSARSSEQQYAEEEIISAAVSITAGFPLPAPLPTATGPGEER